MVGKKPARAPAKATLRRTPLIEWVTAAVGLALFVGVIGVLLADAVEAHNGAPPALIVEQLGATRTPAGWVVEFEARNASQRPAAEIQVTGVVAAGGAELERRSATLDYLPGRGRARGGLLFRHDPADGDLQLSAEGYREP